MGMRPDAVPAEVLNKAIDDNSLIGIVREPVAWLETVTKDTNRIFIARDPRDCIVSWYYARSLHKNDPFPPPIHAGDETLKSYLSDTGGFIEYIENIAKFGDRICNSKHKYEDIIDDPLA